MRTWPFQKLPKYPRMAPADVTIWERFIHKFPDYYTTVAYDVLVGQGIVATNEPDPKFRADYEDLTKKRIDVVGFRKQTIDIIEVKPRASGSAFGQILNYTRLFNRDNPGTTPINSLIITDSTTPDDEELFRTNNIQLIVV